MLEITTEMPTENGIYIAIWDATTHASGTMLRSRTFRLFDGNIYLHSTGYFDPEPIDDIFIKRRIQNHGNNHNTCYIKTE